jgi:hypothetical protein
MGSRWSAMTDAQKTRYVRGGEAAKEAERLGGRGYAPTKKMVERDARQNLAADQIVAMKSGAEINPATNSASRALSALNLDADVDFDAGVRSLRRSLRNASAAEQVSLAIQDDVINRHDRESRGKSGSMQGIPDGVTEALPTDSWRLLPHDVALPTFKHFRGSFPLATDAAEILGQCNQKGCVSVAYNSKLMQFHTDIHRPAVHDNAPVITRAEATLCKWDCYLAGFCVHGADGRDVVAMRLQLRLALTKVRFPADNKTDRNLLSKGGVVICAVAERHAAVTAAGGVAAADALVSVLNHWVHIGAIDLKAVEFEAQTLTIMGASNLPLAEVRPEVNLEGTWQFVNSWDFVKEKDKSLKWYFRCFFLPALTRMLGKIRPLQCTVSEMVPWPNDDNRKVLFWNGARDSACAKRLEESRQMREARAAAQPRLPDGPRNIATPQL